MVTFAKVKDTVVNIRLQGQHVLIEPAPKALLRALRTTELVTKDEETGPVIRRRSNLFDTFGGTRGDPLIAQIGAGLLPVVRHLLRNYDVKVESTGDDFRPTPLSEPIFGKLKPSNFDESWLHFVRNHDRGLVRLQTNNVSVPLLIAQLAQAYPAAKITVAVARRSDGARVRSAIRKRGIDAEFFHSRYRPDKSPRVAVTTYHYLQQRSVDLNERDIVIAYSAQDAVSRAGMELLPLANRARLFAFLPRPAKLTPHQLDLVRSVFGFHELAIPRPGYHERRVAYVRCVVGDGPDLPPDATAFVLQRDGVWGNAPRNALIAHVARLVQEANTTELGNLSPKLALAIANVATPHVIIAVATVPHAFALAELLADWPILAGPTLRGLSAAQQERMHVGQPPENTTPTHAIVTIEALKSLKLKHYDVLVRADAGSSLLPMADATLVERNTKPERPLLLVDINDRHGPLISASQQRRDAYVERGWYPAGLDPVKARVGLFAEHRARGPR